MDNINTLFIERNNILESISYFDSLDYLYESIDLLLEVDNNSTSNDSLRENDKKININTKKIIGDMIKILIEWFTKLKNAMINFFKGFKNINHKEMIKKIFVDKEKHDKKVRIKNYVNMRNGISNVTSMINKIEQIFNNMRSNNNADSSDYKNQVARALGMKSLAIQDLRKKTTECFVKNNETIKIKIGQLNEQIVSSYLLGSSDAINNIEKWKNDIRSTMQKVDTEIYRDNANGKIDQQTANRFTSLLKTHVGIIERICVFAMKCVKQGYKDFNRLVTGYGTRENLENDDGGNENEGVQR